MQNPKSLLLAMVLCAIAFGMSACVEEQKESPQEITARAVSTASIGCPCCPPPLVSGSPYELVGTANNERVRTERSQVSNSAGTSWATRDSYAFATLREDTTIGGGGCCPCFTYSATSTHTMNKSNRVTLDSTPTELGSLEFAFPSAGTAFVTVIGEVVSTEGKATQAQVEFTLGKTEPDKSLAAVERTKALAIPTRHTGEEAGSIVMFRESFTVDQTTTVFSLKATGPTAGTGDYVGNRVIHVTFLPDIE